MLQYVRLQDAAKLPRADDLRPYKAVVVIEAPVSASAQEAISRWLVESGCLYMMAWGPGCSAWDTSVDEANLEQFGYGEIPDDSDVMTTWHERDTLEEVFWFAKHTAAHPVMELTNTLILHLGTADRRAEYVDKYEKA